MHGSCYVAFRSGSASGADTPAARRVSKRHASTTMIMKFCPNYGCVAYGRVVYTQSTRCVFCRWDLKPPRMKSETAGDKDSAMERTEEPAGLETRAHHRRRPALRHTA
jgi:hypothetical protein